MIKIISFVDTFKHYNEPILEFQKRLWASVEFVKLKPSKKKNISEIVLEESLELKKVLAKFKWYKVLLYIDWKTRDSLDFAKFIEDKQEKFSNLVFVVWWAYWVDFEKIADFIDEKFSFWPMTFPHSQAILMLYEQIYRAQMIKKWSSYHH